MNRRTVTREISVFLSFLTLTVLMTWPWALHLHDAVSDRGDPYSIAYWLWWDYHQTFHDPLNLFQATAFYPYKYTMAFTENNYGVSLLFFPLFALGFRPLTVLSIATLIAFVFSGYGMFRLVRTLTDSLGAAWIAGIVFAFVPYHFQRLPHLHLIFTGWIPLLLEALVLYAAQRSWRRAAWLGIAFVMNALTSVTWFILTLVPLTLTGIFLIAWWHLLRDRNFWIRSVVVLGLASSVILCFLFPYYRVHQLYGFARSPDQVIGLSAWPIHWLAVSERNKLWTGLGGKVARDELMLFPGFLPPVLAVAAFLLVRPASRQFSAVITRIRSSVSFRILLVVLDCLAVLLVLITLLTIGYSGIHLRLFGVEILQSTHPTRPLVFFVITVCIRLLLARPQFVYRIMEQGYTASIRSNPRTIGYVLGLIWAVTGFLGSLGMNHSFHRFLYDTFFFFRSMRAPARWAMIAYVGLAILAGLGASQVVDLFVRWRPKLQRWLIYCTLAILLLFEQRVVPLVFVRGEVDPDAMSLRLKATPMSGGIVELPAERDNYAYFKYMLRAADHGRPIVTASSSYAPPLLQEIESLTLMRPIPPRLLDVLEGIPTSYLVVHKALLTPESRSAITSFIKGGVAERRLRLIHRDGDSSTGDELYALTRIEPLAQPDPNPIDDTRLFVRQQYLDLLSREPNQGEQDHLVNFINGCNGVPECLAGRRSQAALEIFRSDEFKKTQLLLYGLHYLTFARPPSYEDWTKELPLLAKSNTNELTLPGEWVQTEEFKARYPIGMSESAYVDKLFRNFEQGPTNEERQAIAALTNRKINRAEILHKVAEMLLDREAQYSQAFVTMCYFDYLKRNPDPQGFDYWLKTLRDNSNDFRAVITGFISSGEYRSQFGQP